MEQLLLPIDDIIGELTERTFDKHDPWDKGEGGSTSKLWVRLDGELLHFWNELQGQARLPYDDMFFKRENRFVQNAGDLVVLELTRGIL